MNGEVSVKLDTAAMVRDFLRAHPLEGTSYITSLARFEELLERAEELASQYRAGVIMARAASAQRRELRHVLQSELLPHLVGVGRLAAKSRAELDRQFTLPRGNQTHRAFLTAAKGMLAKAEGQKEALVDEGMSETLLEDLSKAVTGFEAASEASGAGRRDHVGARIELEGVTAAIMERIGVLDGLVRYRFRKDGELLAAWESARNVKGPSRKAKVVPPTAGDGVVPPASGGAVSAA